MAGNTITLHTPVTPKLTGRMFFTVGSVIA
ncbi:uncharacterized protein METZ01_LOCUS294302 [marine metagenome]|uniref:Uncharacterized protein n=1 Tax=marine metagenome TaxID=408172 RepID=A0A382LY86_9ZZZZ